MPLQIRPSHLTPRADAARTHLLRDAARLELEQMRPLGVDAGDQEADAVGAVAVVLGVCLGAVADARGDLADGNGARVGQAMGEGLLLHAVGEHAGIGGETCQSHAQVGVYGDDLLLVGGEFFCVALVGWLGHGGGEPGGEEADL